MSVHVCQYCNKQLNRRERDRQQCSCGALQMLSHSFAPVRGHAAVAEEEVPERPWMPTQLLGVTVLFGPLACGVAAGVNYARMGMRQYLAPCILLGSVLFVLLSLFLIFQAPASAAQALGLLANFAIGGLFQFIQKPAFDQWKQANWKSATEGEVYKPTRNGLLVLLCFVSLAVEVAVIFVLVGFEANR